MRQLLWLQFVGFLSGSWVSLKVVQSSNSDRGIYNRSLCYDTRSGRTCFTSFFTNHHHPVRRSFEHASDLCKATVPGSSLVVIKSAKDQDIVDRFICDQALENETIITDARKLLSSESRNWSWMNGHQIIPGEVTDKGESLPEASAVALSFRPESLVYLLFNVSSKFSYICENSDSKLTSSHRHNNKFYVAREALVTWYDARKNCLRSEGDRDLASITDHRQIVNWSRLTENQTYWIGLHRNKWIWKSTGDAITYTNWEDGYPDESSDKQCICFNPQIWIEIDECLKDRKWWSCNCNNNYAILCQKDIVATEEKFPSTSATFKSTLSTLVKTTTTSQSKSSSSLLSTTITRITTTTPGKSVISTVTTYTSDMPLVVARGITGNRATTLSSPLTQEPPDRFSHDQTTAFASSSSTALFKSFGIAELLLVLLLFVTVVLIPFIVNIVIRKCKHAGRNEGSLLKKTDQNEAVSNEYESMVPDNRPSCETVHIYTELKLTQQPTPSNTNVQPTGDAADMDISVIYVDPHEI